MKKLIVFILAAVLVSCSQQETFNKEVKQKEYVNNESKKKDYSKSYKNNSGIDRLVGKDRIIPITLTPTNSREEWMGT